MDFFIDTTITFWIASLAGKHRWVSFSLLFHCGCCGRYGHHGGCGHCCDGAYETITSIHFLVVEIGQIFDFSQFRECMSDGQTNRLTDGETLNRDARMHLKRKLQSWDCVQMKDLFRTISKHPFFFQNQMTLSQPNGA